jgi:hypothetical protein
VTSKGRAHNQIPQRLMTFLRLAYKRRTSDIGYVVHDKGKQILDIGGAWDGKPDRFRSGEFWPRLQASRDRRRYASHARHTCGTWMAMAGVP